MPVPDNSSGKLARHGEKLPYLPADSTILHLLLQREQEERDSQPCLGPAGWAIFQQIGISVFCLKNAFAARVWSFFS
jgi:hypothetical protein